MIYRVEVAYGDMEKVVVVEVNGERDDDVAIAKAWGTLRRAGWLTLPMASACAKVLEAHE